MAWSQRGKPTGKAGSGLIEQLYETEEFKQAYRKLPYIPSDITLSPAQQDILLALGSIEKICLYCRINGSMFYKWINQPATAIILKSILIDAVKMVGRNEFSSITELGDWVHVQIKYRLRGKSTHVSGVLITMALAEAHANKMLKAQEARVREYQIGTQLDLFDSDDYYKPRFVTQLPSNIANSIEHNISPPNRLETIQSMNNTSHISAKNEAFE